MCSSGVFQKHVKKLVARAKQPGEPATGNTRRNNTRQKRRFSVIGIKGEKYLLIMKFSIRHIQ